jgi:gamma-glutamyl:cysteine ligase YbdK (ATP-grasp superfamily)
LLETTRVGIDSKLVDSEKARDQALRDRRSLEHNLEEVRAENEMLYKSEERVRRLLEETSELKAQLRARERDYGIIAEQHARLSQELAARDRQDKLREMEDADRRN